MFEFFVRAYDYARQQHAGQTRLDGEEYINHPVRVAMEVMRYPLTRGDMEVALVSSLLHDVVEDTPATSEDVAERFGAEVARVIMALSHEDEEESDEVYLARVAAGGDIAVR